MPFRAAIPLALRAMFWLSSDVQAKEVCTVLADAGGKILIQRGACRQRVTPASTFKIALSLMGYDSGYLVDEHLPTLPFHEGYAAWNPAWKTATDPAAWIANSVVWFSQRFTEWLGERRFRLYVEQFHYGNEDVSGGLTEAWLSSSLQISPLEQVAFLEKVVARRLPVSAHAYEMTSRITTVAALTTGWDVHGKTGTGSPRKADGSPDEAHSYGWFVGWAVQKSGRTVVFARLIQDDKPEAGNAGLRVREQFMRELPSLLNTN